MIQSYVGLAGRILLLGVERIAVKRLGQASDAVSGAFVFFALGAVVLAPFTLMEPQGVRDFVVGNAFAGALAAGLFYAAAFICYVKSLAEGEVSLTAPLYNFNIVFLAVLAALFASEPLTWSKAGGLALMLFGVSLLKREGNPLRSLLAVFRDAACRYMAAASLFIAVGRVIDKSMIQSIRGVEPVVYAFFLYAVISVYIFLYAVYSGRVVGIYAVLRNHFGLSLLCGVVNGISYLLLLIALLSIQVSVAEPVSMLGLLVTMVLARYVLGERVGPRLPGAVVMLCGAWLLL